MLASLRKQLNNSTPPCYVADHALSLPAYISSTAICWAATSQPPDHCRRCCQAELARLRKQHAERAAARAQDILADLAQGPAQAAAASPAGSPVPTAGLSETELMRTIKVWLSTKNCTDLHKLCILWYLGLDFRVQGLVSATFENSTKEETGVCGLL